MIKVSVFMAILIFGSLTFALGGELPAPPEVKPEYVESCIYYSEIEFKKAYPKHVINRISYRPDQSEKDTLIVTVNGSDPNVCSNLPPEVIYCSDFGNSIRVKCVRGEIVDIF